MDLVVNAALFSSKTAEWETPKELFDRLNAVYNFTVDVCATPSNAKCDKYFTPWDDGLKQDWTGVCWMNPPYGRGISKWVRKAYNESRKGCVVVALLPARTDTKWFHDWIYMTYGTQVEFLRGRLKFSGSKWNAPFPCMIVVFKAKFA